MLGKEAPAGASGAALLRQLGRLIVRARSTSPRRRNKPLASTSQQIQSQPRSDEEARPGVEAQLNSHVHALWNEQIPVCIEVLLAPDCPECYASLNRTDEVDKQRPALLLERWTMRAVVNKTHDTPAFMTSQWLLNAVRSQLHFSQLAAWLARLKASNVEDAPTERRRKHSRETCNFKKLESNCDDDEDRKLNIIYSIKIPGENYKTAEFNRTPTDHNFPITDIGNNLFLKVMLQSLPRLEDIPVVKCACKRRTSKDIPVSLHEELVGKLNDLTLGPRTPRRSVIANHEDKLLDDRMLTPCSENGKHKCNCDDESDGNRSSLSPQEPKKLDERRLKEIAKYKRRLRKESKLKKLSDSTSSEGDLKRETHTSIPILQASRFDRFRAIGCYRNQTYLTLPASRMEGRSPFTDTLSLPTTEFKKTNTVATQTEDITCQCGSIMEMKCTNCTDRGMVRSEGIYNLASYNGHCDTKLKKHKCDNNMCDININDNISDKCDLIKRPKLRRFYPIVDRIGKVVSDRCAQDIKDLNLRDDDTVFSCKPEPKRQKTYSISEDYVLYEKCDYGTIDNCDMSSPTDCNGFRFPEVNQVPSPTEMDKFRWRFDSAASMVFHTKTGLPLTSSPAPLRRGNNSFDFDDSINGISGIKSALFHPIPAPCGASPTSTARRTPPPRAPPQAQGPTPTLRIGPSTGLLGSFEESALKGRLEPVATVHGFTAELGASGAFCPPHKRLPVTVFFYAPGGTNAPYMGHINLGPGGYRVSRSGTIQVSLFNPHGTLVKMFVVLYDLTCMPPLARTFLRQRTLYLPAGAGAPPPRHLHKWLRYLIHLRFMTSKSGKLYLHTDIRILVSRKADLDTATAHSALFRPIPTRPSPESDRPKPESDRPNPESDRPKPESDRQMPESVRHKPESPDRTPNRVFGGCSEFDTELKNDLKEIGYENQNGVSYELRSFTYAPENPKYSPR